METWDTDIAELFLAYLFLWGDCCYIGWKGKNVYSDQSARISTSESQGNVCYWFKNVPLRYKEVSERGRRLQNGRHLEWMNEWMDALPTRLLMRRANSKMVCSSGFPCRQATHTLSVIFNSNLILRELAGFDELTRLTGLLMLLFISNTRPFTRSLVHTHRSKSLSNASPSITFHCACLMLIVRNGFHRAWDLIIVMEKIVAFSRRPKLKERKIRTTNHRFPGRHGNNFNCRISRWYSSSFFETPSLHLIFLTPPITD